MRIDRTLRQFDLDTLRLFLAVAEERNIARAADREHIAASAVSKRIQELERGLAIPLFRRGSRGVRLTAAGEALVHHARSVFAILDRMRGEISEHEKGTVGYVRVAANASAIVEFLADDLPAFLAGHPGIRIDLEQDFSLNIVRAVRDGVVDIGVFGAAVPTGGLKLLPYRSDRLVVLAPARHPLAKQRSVRTDPRVRSHRHARSLLSSRAAHRGCGADGAAPERSSPCHDLRRGPEAGASRPRHRHPPRGLCEAVRSRDETPIGAVDRWLGASPAQHRCP